jgi:hypothetical protein
MAQGETSVVGNQRDPHEARQPGAAHRRLDVFLGHWKVEGENGSAAPAAPGARVRGEETYDWMPGGFFLIARWVHRFDSALHEGIGFIGHDPITGAYTANHFDNLGYHRAYRLAEANGVWSFVGTFERARMRFDGDGNGFAIEWELSKDGLLWQPLCNLRGTRLHG